MKNPSPYGTRAETRTTCLRCSRSFRCPLDQPTRSKCRACESSLAYYEQQKNPAGREGDGTEVWRPNKGGSWPLVCNTNPIDKSQRSE